MDELVIFTCLFLPTLALNYLTSSRDIMLFQTRPRMRRAGVLALMAAGMVALTWIGFSLSWAAALVLPGPAGAALGDWLATGGWIVLRYRLLGR